MDSLKGLPAFFQNNAKSVVAGLESFQLEPSADGDELGGLIDDEPLPPQDEETFGNIEFDENDDSLPEFFASTKPVSQTQSTTPANSFQQNVSVAGGAPRPPGLTPSKAPAPAPASFSSPSAAHSGIPPAPQLFATPPPPGVQVRIAPPMPAAAPSTATPQLTVPASAASSLLLSSLRAGNTGAVNTAAATTTPSSSTAPQLTIPGAVFGTPVRETSAASSVTAALPQTPISLTHQKPSEFLGRGKFMSASDVRYVVGKALQPLETLDPYADDFYNIQFKIKKNRTEREAALQAGRPAPEPTPVPTPTWKETKERIKQQMDMTRRGFVDKVKEWEEKEQVLGHRIRAEVTKPKALLSLPVSFNAEDLLMDLDLDQDNGLLGAPTSSASEWKSPFNSRLWSTRAAVQQGYEALFTVQELQQLAQHPSVAANPIAVEEIKREMDSAVTLLSQSLGIRSLVASASPLHAASQHSLTAEYSLDGRHVSAILQTAIGKKLLIRGIKLLSPSHRWALIPIILARLLMPAPASATPAAASQVQEYQQVERKLLSTIADYLQHCFAQHRELYQHLQQQQQQAQSYSRELLGHLRQCLKNIMITQMDRKAQLREALLAEKTRAEVLYLVVQLGDQVLGVWTGQGGDVSATAAQAKMEWVQTREAFMSLLESGGGH